MLKYHQKFTKEAGVYSILDTGNKKLYVGSTINIRNRIGSHKSYIKCGKHPLLPYLSGEPLVFKVLETCEDVTPFNLLERENFWVYELDTLQPNGLNAKMPHVTKKIDRRNKRHTRSIKPT